MGREILTDDQGFLINMRDWSQNLMFFMAQKDGITLSDDHILVIEAVQNYYKEFATTPPIRNLIAYLKKTGHSDFNSIKLAILFPDGAAKQASRYAGLPKPVKCI